MEKHVFPQQKGRNAEPVGPWWRWEMEPSPLQVEQGEPPTWWGDPQVSVKALQSSSSWLVQFFLHQVQMRQPTGEEPARLAQETLRRNNGASNSLQPRTRWLTWRSCLTVVTAVIWALAIITAASFPAWGSTYLLQTTKLACGFRRDLSKDVTFQSWCLVSGDKQSEACLVEIYLCAINSLGG